MDDLKEQVKSLTKIVAELTELKAKEWSPLQLCDLVLSPDDNSSIPSKTPPEIPSSADNTPVVVPEQPVHHTVPVTGQNLSVQLTSSINTCPRPQLLSPLAMIDNNHQVTNSSSRLGPTDEQKRKVEAIVLIRFPSRLPRENCENGSSYGRTNQKYLVSLRTLRKSECFWNMVQFTSTVIIKVKTLKALIAWFLFCMTVCKFKVALNL